MLVHIIAAYCCVFVYIFVRAMLQYAMWQVSVLNEMKLNVCVWDDASQNFGTTKHDGKVLSVWHSIPNGKCCPIG